MLIGGIYKTKENRVIIILEKTDDMIMLYKLNMSASVLKRYFCIDCLKRSLQDEHFENHVMYSNVKETEENNDGYFGQVPDELWKNIKDKIEKFKNK